MSAEKLIAAQLHVAKEDLEGAMTLAASGNRNAVYLLEQAAEKILLAVLTSEGQHGGIRHQLSEMTAQLSDKNPLKPALLEVARLEVFATTYRYPTPSGRIAVPPSSEAFRSLAEKVQRLLIDVSARLGVDLHDKSKSASRCDPIR